MAPWFRQPLPSQEKLEIFWRRQWIREIVEKIRHQYLTGLVGLFTRLAQYSAANQRYKKVLFPFIADTLHTMSGCFHVDSQSDHLPAIGASDWSGSISLVDLADIRFSSSIVRFRGFSRHQFIADVCLRLTLSEHRDEFSMSEGLNNAGSKWEFLDIGSRWFVSVRLSLTALRSVVTNYKGPLDGSRPRKSI